ncbi:hypothetical protein Tco_0580282 [Tanacetum coccineum]
MVVLESCPKYNMAAYLEKTDGNAEFHEIIDFLTRSSIHYALTVSPVISTTFVDQFWTSVKSQTINNVRYINAKVVGKPVTISEASIRSDLHFNDVDGIDSLNNQAIFDAIKLMGSKSTYWDQIPINIATAVICLTSNQKFNFSMLIFEGKVTPLFPNMLVQPTEDEGEGSERPYELQPTPSPPHPSEAHVEPQSDPSPGPSPTISIPDPIPKGSSGNLGSAPTVPTNTEWDDLDMDIDDTMDYTLAQDEGKTDKVDEKGEKGTVEPEPRESTSSAAQTTPTPTPTTFGDDETIAQVLLNMSQAKAIDPNDKGKKRIKEDEESDTESEEITEAKKKFDQIAHDEETALSNEYDFIQARIEADRLLAERVQEAEREQFTVEERIKFLHDTIATQKRILAQQRSEAIRNKPPTKNQFRNQMMTYLKHVGNKKHADLKTKRFDEIKALYEKVKRFDDSFITIGSTEDERKIKKINKGASDPDKKKKIVKEDVSAKVPAKQDVAKQGTKKRKGGHMKMISRKRKRPQPDVDSDDEHRKCLKIVTFEEGDYLVVYRVNGNFRAFNNLMEVLHIFDRQDLFHLYDLVRKQYSESTPEGIELILWGDLKIMMESSIEVTDQEFKDGTIIRMLVERKYPFSKELLQRMLDFGLEVKVESTVALDLIRVLNSPCFMVKSWLVQDQTVLGKDYSNLLIADSLLKTIWFINAPCYGNEALASPKANGVWHVKRGRDTKIPQSSGPSIKVGVEAVHKELGDRMERAATTASSLEAEQDSGNNNKTQSIATLNGSSP